jgi:hypothetical protein
LPESAQFDLGDFDFGSATGFDCGSSGMGTSFLFDRPENGGGSDTVRERTNVNGKEANKAAILSNMSQNRKHARVKWPALMRECFQVER